MEQLAPRAPRSTFVCLHCVHHAIFETLVILLSEFDKLVEVEYDEVGDETDGDHRVGEVVKAEGISSTPDGLLKSVEKVSWG